MRANISSFQLQLDSDLVGIGFNHEQTSAFWRLLELSGLQQQLIDGSLESAVHSALNLIRQHWLRPADKERWQVEDTPEQMQHADEYQASLSQFGFIEECSPTESHYDYVLVLGGLQSRIEARLDYLQVLHDRGFIWGQVVFLGSHRPLDAEHEQLPDGCEGPATEASMMRALSGQRGGSFGDAPPTFVETPMQLNDDGSERRANTADTIRTWLGAESPVAGGVLVISNQPFVGYQAEAVRSQLPPDFIVEGVGPKLSGELPVNTALDSIVRQMDMAAKRAVTKQLIVEGCIPSSSEEPSSGRAFT